MGGIASNVLCEGTIREFEGEKDDKGNGKCVKGESLLGASTWHVGGRVVYLCIFEDMDCSLFLVLLVK